jgi:uncharacterized repeat protein (TIGR01451 family)
VILSVTLFGGGVPSAMAATAAPALQISSVANPTEFSSTDSTACQGESCDRYELLFTNIGGAPITQAGVLTVTDTLPSGVTTTSRSPGDKEEYWQCSGGEGQQVVTCTISDELLLLLHPGASETLSQVPALTVYVQVQPGVPPDSTRTGSVTVSGGGAAPVSVAQATLINPSAATMFGVADFSSYLADLEGAPDIQAADHPNSLTTSLDVTSIANYPNGQASPTLPSEDVKGIVVDLPPGFVGNPQTAPRCALHDLVASSNSSGCSPASQVGRLSFDGLGSYGGEFSRNGRQNIPVYNMVPEQGYPAEFGFMFASFPAVIHASVVGSGAGTHLRAAIFGVPATEVLGFQGAELTFFGDPVTHDSGVSPGAAFFTNPSSCSGEPLTTTLHVDSWEHPGAERPDGTPDFSGSAWKSATSTAAPVTGCEALSFLPTFALAPSPSSEGGTTQAGEPSSYAVDLHVPQGQITDPGSLATPDLKKAVVTLPAGVVVNPSAANGLGACSPAQIALEDNDTPACPDTSKIGTVEVDTPLLDHPLPGSIFLAEQNANPFGSLLAIYIVVDDPQTGVVIKLPGKVEANPGTGQLTATFDNNPQLPFEDVELVFKGGPRAPLANPDTCGTKTTTTELTPWSAPQSGPPAMPSSSFEINQNCHGAQFNPSFTAGTVSPIAGAFSPFTLTFSRSDQDQTLGGITVQTPPGLLGKIAGVPQCSEAQANAGTCGVESLIGHTTVGAGPGPDPFYVGGSVYLTGPYGGAPFGLSIVVPVVAGPFNLGTEVVRAAIAVNPHTAQITVTSNPLPTIKQGIPFQVRTVNVTIDRSGFMFNPTNCTPATVGATITSTTSASAGVASPFQAANCANLPFKPVFTASTQGKTSKADGASLIVKVAQKPGEANIHKVDLTLPKILPARLTTLQKACTEAQFNTNPAGCPATSLIGTAKAVTPVINVPLTGPAYLVSHGGAAFPDVEFVLQGEGVEIVLDGGTDIKKGITYSRFETVPDAPISSFETNLPEGPHSALAANGNLCATTKTVGVRKRVRVRVHGRIKHVTKTVKEVVAQSLTMPTTITGQNGAVLKQATKIGATGCSKAKKKRRRKQKEAIKQQS